MLSTERLCPGPSDAAQEAVHTKAVSALGSPSVAAAPAAGATAWFAGVGPDDAQAALVAQVSNAAVAVSEAVPPGTEEGERPQIVRDCGGVMSSAGGLSNVHVCGRKKLQSTGCTQCVWCQAVRSGQEQLSAYINQTLMAYHRPSATPSLTDTVDGHGVAPLWSLAPVAPSIIILSAVLIPSASVAVSVTSANIATPLQSASIPVITTTPGANRARRMAKRQAQNDLAALAKGPVAKVPVLAAPLLPSGQEARLHIGARTMCPHNRVAAIVAYNASLPARGVQRRRNALYYAAPRVPVEVSASDGPSVSHSLAPGRKRLTRAQRGTVRGELRRQGLRRQKPGRSFVVYPEVNPRSGQSQRLVIRGCTAVRNGGLKRTWSRIDRVSALDEQWDRELDAELEALCSANAATGVRNFNAPPAGASVARQASPSVTMRSKSGPDSTAVKSIACAATPYIPPHVSVEWGRTAAVCTVLNFGVRVDYNQYVAPEDQPELLRLAGNTVLCSPTVLTSCAAVPGSLPTELSAEANSRGSLLGDVFHSLFLADAWVNTAHLTLFYGGKTVSVADLDRTRRGLGLPRRRGLLLGRNFVRLPDFSVEPSNTPTASVPSDRCGGCSTPRRTRRRLALRPQRAKSPKTVILNCSYVSAVTDSAPLTS